jgi:hypothetical protein
MSIESRVPAAPSVTIAISTLGTGILTLDLPPQRAEIVWLVLVQAPPADMPPPVRADLTVVPLTGRGLSRSRNAALDHCTTPYLLFSDDDMTLRLDAVMALAEVLEQAPELGFVAGWRVGRRPDGAGEARLSRRNSGRICAPELLVRAAAVRDAGVRFDPAFGVGSPQPIGEDYVFVCDMLHAGLKGRSVPVETGAHAGSSTGADWGDPVIQEARRAVLRRCFGPLHLPVRALYAWHHRQDLGGLWGAVGFLSGKG